MSECLLMVFLELNFVFLFNELSLTNPQGYQAREVDKQFAALVYFAVQTELNCFPCCFSSHLTSLLLHAKGLMNLTPLLF